MASRAPGVVRHGKLLFARGEEPGLFLRRAVAHPGDFRDARAYGHAAPREDLQGHRPGKAQRRGEPAGKVPAAARVRKALVFHKGRVIRVRGPRPVFQAIVIAGTRVGVLDQRAQRRAAGEAARQAADHTRLVRLLAGGGMGVLPGRAAPHEAPHFLQIDGFPGGQAVHHRANRLRMRLAKNRYAQVVAIARGHPLSLPIAGNRRRTRGTICSPPARPGW